MPYANNKKVPGYKDRFSIVQNDYLDTTHASALEKNQTSNLSQNRLILFSRQIFLLLPILFLCQAISAEPMTVEKLRAKYPRLRKEVLFQTPEFWAERRSLFNNPPSSSILKEINARNVALKKAGKHFTVGYSKLYGKHLQMTTGMANLKNIKELPLPPSPGQFGKRLEKLPGLSCLEIAAQATDRFVDMRDYDIITSVRNQNTCGSCWAFATVAGFETSILLTNGINNGINCSNLHLSEEQVLSCTGDCKVADVINESNNCNGGLQPCAAQYICSNPLVTNFAWPYVERPETPKCLSFQQKGSSNYQALTWGYVCNPNNLCFTPSVNEIKQAIIKYGSVVCGICLSPNFQDYSGNDVFDANDATNNDYAGIPITNHVIQIIGWDDDKQAWLIKNSWGEDWGIGGFGWVGYGVNKIGAFAIWIQARQYVSDPCAGTGPSIPTGTTSTGPSIPTGTTGTGPSAPTVTTSTGNTPTTAKLTKVVVTFDNCCQAKSNTQNYWLDLNPGTEPTGNGTIGTYGCDNTNEGKVDYSRPANVTMYLYKNIAFQDFISIGSGNLIMKLHGQFGGLHFNDDWQTNVALKLIFDNGATYTIKTSSPQHFHTDHNNQTSYWTGKFTFNGQSNQYFH